MIVEQKHIIKKVFIEVDTNNTDVAYKLKDNLDVFLKEEILPYLEQYFKSIEHQLPAEIVQIPYLNLEINVNSLNNFEALKTDAKVKLVQKIESLLRMPKASGKLILMDAQERQVKSLLFFIEHGYAPWWKTSDDSLLFTTVDFNGISSSNVLQDQFVELLKKNVAKKRSILQFTNIELQLLLQAIFKSHKEVEIVNKQVVGEIKPLHSKLRVLVWTTIIDYLLSKNESVLVQKLYKELVKETKTKNDQALAKVTLFILMQLLKIKKEITIKKKKKPIDNTSRKKDTIVSNIIYICSEKGLSEEAVRILQSVKHLKTSKKTQTINSEDNNILQDKFYEENTNHVSQDAYYVQNAGLVLVHLYIVLFFKNCGLLNSENAFLDREKAVHALHYLATKKEQQLESDMVFEKFICGIPITESINRQVELSDTIKLQAEELLESIIENWDALGNASTDLLRYEFLQREGRLSFKDDNPKITIERKTQDILVDKLPWGINLFKLPWFDKLIFTDW